uniref:gasdermin Eb n=1 Tax=Doryrhamphus excisus TaxID=161450 RepID=UPI0025AEC8A9|nr:gasdermin Eb [Doryrhamphus excisus]XP_057939798.1 gasdermin Eb [Doryrhamphus excisus]XP_057939799.1 gasdermin Eb [Doryrhamphus excisus]XP_057939800.1 gasdermin Eb [Doryrhamphus excisus]
MFATATRNFVEEVDPGGLLIPVRSLNDAITLLTVVVRQKRFWFWQKPKHLPTDFTLNDILTGDTITPGVIETDFIKYNGTYGDNIQGTMDANFIHSNVNMEGKESSKLQSSFGSLKKDEVDVRKLLQDSKNRVLDMSHCLIQQTRKNRQVFGIVKERIVTCQPCCVIEEVQQTGQCAGTLSLCGPKSPKLSLKDNGSLSKDSNVTMEIPTNTTLAYALIELEVKHDGRYELCLMSNTKGGFEVDSPAGLQSVTDLASVLKNPEISRLRQELDGLHAHFQRLATLPSSIKSSLLQVITAVLEDRTALGALQSTLDRMLLDKSADVADVPLAHKENIQTVLDALAESDKGSEESTTVLSAVHLVTSALDELTTDCLAALRLCCSADVLKILDLLVKSITASEESPAIGTDTAALTEDILSSIEHLLASSKVTLRNDGDALRTEINHNPGNRPLIMCIALRGLYSLAHCL